MGVGEVAGESQPHCSSQEPRYRPEVSHDRHTAWKPAVCGARPGQLYQPSTLAVTGQGTPGQATRDTGLGPHSSQWPWLPLHLFRYSFFCIFHATAASLNPRSSWVLCGISPGHGSWVTAKGTRTQGHEVWPHLGPPGQGSDHPRSSFPMCPVGPGPLPPCRRPEPSTAIIDTLLLPLTSAF